MIIIFVVTGKADTVKLLIDNGAKVNTRNNQGFTPLHRAAQQRSPDAAQVLIENGADVNAENIQRDTPLHWAAFYGSPAVAKLLIECGANINAKNNKGDTPRDHVGGEIIILEKKFILIRFRILRTT